MGMKLDPSQRKKLIHLSRLIDERVDEALEMSDSVELDSAMDNLRDLAEELSRGANDIAETLYTGGGELKP